MIHPDLKRIDNRAISDDKKEIRLFSVMQNEELRLPYYFEYYRRMGVTQFFVIDNASTDGTQKFLLEQPDCCVFYTDKNYAERRFGVEWVNTLLDAYGDGRWILMVDADEIFVYPRCEQNLLPKFCRWLEDGGHEGVFILMLDMYSAGPVAKVNYNRGENFLTACDYFDKNYHYVRRLALPFQKHPFPDFEPIGGPRLRLCFPQQNTKAIWPRLRVKIMRRVLRVFQKFGFLKGLELESVAPQAFKIPLVKWKRGYGFITSHRLNPIRLAPVSGALLHFKYLQDFVARVHSAVSKLNHYDGSAEYKTHAQLLTKQPDLSMMYTGSVQYKSSDDLVRLMLIKTDPDWANQ